MGIYPGWRPLPKNPKKTLVLLDVEGSDHREWDDECDGGGDHHKEERLIRLLNPGDGAPGRLGQDPPSLWVVEVVNLHNK